MIPNNDALIKYLLKNANNNTERVLLVKPSDFGYDLFSNGTEECMNFLRGCMICKYVEKISGNLIRVNLKV